MKLFSNLWASIAMLLMLSLATSCEKSEQPTPAEPEYVTVSLGLDVSLDYDYEPLTRAEENNDLYVFRSIQLRFLLQRMQSGQSTPTVFLTIPTTSLLSLSEATSISLKL